MICLDSLVSRIGRFTSIFGKAIFRYKNSRDIIGHLKDGDFIVYLLIMGFAILYSYFAIAKYRTFSFHEWYDLGVFNQCLWTTLHYGVVNGQILWNTTNFGQLPIHLSLSLLFYLPFYAIYQGPETVIIVGSFLLRLGTLPLYWLARDEFKSKRIGLLFALIYLTYALQMGTSWMFHSDAAMPAFLLFSFYYLKKQDWSKYFLFIVLALTTKEIVPLVTVPLGIYGLVFNRKSRNSAEKRRIFNGAIIYPILTIIISTLWFIMAETIINYYVSSSPWWGKLGNPHNLPWSEFGGTAARVLEGIITDPRKVLSTLITNSLSINPYDSIPNYIYIVRLFAPLALTPLLSLSTMFIPIPYALFLMISSEPNYQRLALQYAAPIIPFIFISTVYGVKRLIMMSSKRMSRLRSI